jgi:putative SOS response-associated peptidase YedK
LAHSGKASLFDSSGEPFQGSQIESFAIIATEPNELMVKKTGHDRMPAIIKRKD